MHNNFILKYVCARASRCEHIILPISSTAIFSVLIKKKIRYMLDATSLPRRFAVMCYIVVIQDSTVQ